MTELVWGIHRGLSAGIDLVLRPFNAFSPVWGLVVISAISGVVLLFFYGLVSPQRLVRKTKERIGALLLEVLLFRHDPRLCLRAQLRLFGQGAKYFALAVPPLIVLTIPCIFLLVQLHVRFGVRGLGAGEAALLRVAVREKSQLDDVAVVPEPGVVITPPVRVSDPPEILWRVTRENAGALHVKVLVNNGNLGELETPVTTVEERRAVSGGASASWMTQFLSPGALLSKPADSVIKSVEFSYPERELRIWNIGLSWVVVFFVVSFVSGLVASRFLGVEI